MSYRESFSYGKADVVSPLVEQLEDRLLLTTLVGGDTFEYIDATGQTIRIVLEGNIIAELVAADIDGSNNVLLGDMPGHIYASSTVSVR